MFDQMRAYHGPGEPDVQVVDRRGRLLLTVPLPAHAPDATLGVMVDGREWVLIEPRPADHPNRYGSPRPPSASPGAA